jgi:hypothetical protein
MKYTKRVDEVGALIYIGEATPGTAASSALWRVQRITLTDAPSTSTNDVLIEWADGDANFNNIWDNRASLTYS